MEASLRIREEVVIERWDDNEIELTSTLPCRLAQRLTLELAGDGHGQITVVVRQARPLVTSDASLRYRLLVEVDRSTAEAPIEEGAAES